jgi:glycosyltransferase involved in cell wall biosynthesis
MSVSGGQSPFPSVSVVIPTHDRPQLLVRAVESVLQQDYPGEIECLVVFDKAPPTPVPVETPPARSLRTLANCRTPGLAGARNAGALVAGGELLAFLDDDDEWLPRKLSLQVDLMQRERERLVSCGVYVCRGGRRFHRVPPRRITFRDLLRSRHMAVCPCTILVERACFLTDIGLVDERIPGSYAEDYEWLLRATRAHDVPVVQEPLVQINWHRSSYFARDWETIAAAQRYLLRKYPDFAGEPAGKARIAGQVSLALAAAGNRPGARRWAGKTLRLDPAQPRGYIALLVSAGVVRPETVMRLANAFGRGL